MIKQCLSILSLTTIAMVSLVAMPAHSQTVDGNQKNYVGPQIVVSGYGSGFGVNGRIGVAENISVRPHASFVKSSTPGAGDITTFGAGATYEFSLSQPGQPSKFTPYAGVGYDTSSSSFSPATNSAISSLPPEIASQVKNNLNQATSPILSGFYAEIGSDYQLNDTFALNANYRAGALGGFSIGGSYKF
jgi:hypothetical protein